MGQVGPDAAAVEVALLHEVELLLRTLNTAPSRQLSFVALATSLGQRGFSVVDAVNLALERGLITLSKPAGLAGTSIVLTEAGREAVRREPVRH